MTTKWDMLKSWLEKARSDCQEEADKEETEHPGSDDWLLHCTARDAYDSVLGIMDSLDSQVAKGRKI